KRATPLVRWWTGDVVVRDSTPCACGRTLARLPGGVIGRADDMLVIKGVNLFPSAVEDVVRRTEGVVGEYRIVLDDDVTDRTTGALTAIKLRVEADPERVDEVCARLAAAVRAELTVRALVEPVPPGSLDRNAPTARRVLRGNCRPGGHRATEAFLVAGVRTPHGRYGGSLRDVRLVELGGIAGAAALERAGVAADAVDEVVVSNCR